MAEDVGSLVVRVAMENSSFKQGVQNLNRQMKVIKSEFKNATAGMKEHGKELDSLKAKQDMLGKSVNVQSQLVQKYRDKLKGSKDTLNKNAAAQEKLKEKIVESKNAYEKSAKTLGKNNLKTKELEKNYKKLTSEYSTNEDKLRNNVRTIDNWTVKTNNAESKLKSMKSTLSSTSKEIDKQNSKWNKLSNKLDSVSKKFQTVGKKMSSVGREMSMKISAPIAALGVGSAKAAIDFESAFAGVKKTVNGTKEQFANLEKGITDMSKKLPTSATDISHVAEAAGQLGIKTPNILGFTKTIIDLGNATNLVGEEGASQLAKFANITSMSQKDFDRLGSTIVDLGNNMATTEADIVSMGMRLAGAGHQVGITEPKIMGLAAALSSVGIEAEAGGSAMSKVMVEMQLAVEKGGDSLNSFAKVAGMSSSQFQKAFKQDAAGALIAFIKGLETSESKGISAIKVLDDMGITEVRMRDALLRAAGAGDLFNKSIDIGTKAWQENTALTNEANQRYATTESKLKIVKNQIVDSARIIGQNLLPVVRDVSAKIADITQKFSKLSPETQRNIIKIAGLAAAMGPLLLIGGKLVKVTSKICKLFSTVSGAIAVAKTGATAATPAIGALSKVFALLNWKIVAIGAAIGGVIYVGKKLHKYFSQASIQQKKFGNNISKSTKKALGEYEKLDKKVGQSLMSMRVKNSKVTKDMAKDISGNFNKMANKIVNANNSKYNKDYNNLKKFMAKNGGLRKEEQKEILQNIKKKQKFQEDAVRQGQAKINKIIKNASDNNRKISEEEWHVINKIRDNMNKDAIKAMSKSEREQKSLLERQKRNAQVLTTEQAVEVVKNSAKQRDKVIADAEKQYDETVQAIQRQRDELGTISSEQADKLIEAARHQKEETVNQAQGMHKEVVMEAEKQAGEHADKVDWEKGQVKSKWQAMLDDVSAKANQMKENASKAMEEKKQAIANKMEEIKANINNKWNEILNYFATLPSKLRAKGSEMFEAMKNGIASKVSAIKAKCNEIGNSIVSSFKSVPSKLRSIGHNIMDGLKGGLQSKAGEVMSKAGEIAEGIEAKMKERLDIHSPSKVTRKIGQFVDEGLAGGMLDNADIVSEAAKKIADTITKEIEYIKTKLNKDTKDLNNQLYNLQQTENKATRNIKGKQKYSIKDQYEAKKKAIKDQIKLRKEQADKEIKELQRIGKEAKEQLDKEIKIKKKAVDDVNKLNDYIIKALNRKIGKEKEVAIEQAKIKAKESNLTKDQLDSLLKYINEYYDKKLDKDKLQAVAEQLIMSKNQKAIVTLLNAYGDLYQDAGISLGQKLVLGTKSWTDVLPPIISNTMQNIQGTVANASNAIGKNLNQVMKEIMAVGETGNALAGASSGEFSFNFDFDSVYSSWQDNFSKFQKEEENKTEDIAETISKKYKEAFDKIELAQIELGRETRNTSEELKKQQALLDNQKDKLSTLKEKYSEMSSALGSSDDEVIQLKKDIASLTVEIENQQLQICESKSSYINEANDKIKEALQEKYNEELELQENKINKELENLDKWKDESIERIQDVYNARIKALDGELKAEEKAEKDRAELKKINQLKDAIKYEHNEFNKVELQKKLNKSIADREKRLHKEEIEDKKNSLEEKKQNEINNINNLYEANKNNLEKKLQDTKKFYAEKIKLTNLEAEAEKLIINNNQKEIIELIKSYSPQYENAGKSLGQRLANGMKEKIKPVLNMIQNIEDRISSIRTDEIQNTLNSVKYAPIGALGNSSDANSTTNKTVVNNNNITFNSPKALSPSEQKRETETTLRNLAFSV